MCRHFNNCHTYLSIYLLCWIFWGVAVAEQNEHRIHSRFRTSSRTLSAANAKDLCRRKKPWDLGGTVVYLKWNWLGVAVSCGFIYFEGVCVRVVARLQICDKCPWRSRFYAQARNRWGRNGVTVGKYIHEGTRRVERYDWEEIYKYILTICRTREIYMSYFQCTNSYMCFWSVFIMGVCEIEFVSRCVFVCVCVYKFGFTWISVAICAKCDESVSGEIMLVYDLWYGHHVCAVVQIEFVVRFSMMIIIILFRLVDNYCYQSIISINLMRKWS